MAVHLAVCSTNKAITTWWLKPGIVSNYTISPQSRSRNIMNTRYSPDHIMWIINNKFYSSTHLPFDVLDGSTDHHPPLSPY